MRVLIQRGHCFRRTGSTGTAGSGMTEQAHNNDVAGRAAQLLRRDGHVARVLLADERLPGGYDVFMALHCDGSTSRTASGASIGYRTDAGRRAGEVWKRRYQARGWAHGFRGNNYTAALARYYGTGWAASVGITRAFVIEHGFLTNPTVDGRFLTSVQGRQAAALAIADTVQILAGEQPTQGDDEGLPMWGKGDKGESIDKAQQWLETVGYSPGPADGILGDNTAREIRRFEAEHWLFDSLDTSQPPAERARRYGQTVGQLAACVQDQRQGHTHSPGHVR